MPYLQTRMDYATKLFRTAEYEEAKIVFGQLLKLYRKQDIQENMCICLYRLACIAYIRGEMRKFHELFTCYQKWSGGQPEVEYHMLRGLEELSQQRYEQAIRIFTNVLLRAEKGELVEHKISALLYIQTCYIAQGRMQLSLEMSDELWTAHQKEVQLNAGHFFHYLLNRADTLHTLERLKEMDELLEVCEVHEDLVAMPQEHIRTLMTRAKLHMARCEPRKATLSLEKAVEIAEKQGDINLRYEVYEALIDNYEIRGKTKQALRYEKKQRALPLEAVKK